MPTQNLSRLFSPKSIAVIGASDVPGKVGYNVLQNIMQGGYAGSVFPINARTDRVQGQKAWSSLDQLPSVPELAVICTPASTVPGLIRQCGSMGVAGVVILTAGFRELGEEGAKLETELLQAQKLYPATRLLGPNCVGFIHPETRLSASFAVGMPREGSVAFLSQSGALCTAVLDWALTKDVGFSHFVSVGNQLDVGFADLLDYLAEDSKTTAAILYIESIPNSRYFMSAARAFARNKPLIAYKAGRFAESAKAAASHTGAMAGVDAVYQAAMDRAGIVRVFDMQSLFQCAELLTTHPSWVGPRLAIVTNAGGPGVMATDALLERRGTLATLSPPIYEKLNSFLPFNWSHSNPVDVIGDADPERFAHAVEVVLQDPQVDSVLAILTPQAMTNPTETAKRVASITVPSNKTLLTCWMGGYLMREGRALLQESHLPHFVTPEQAIQGLMHLTGYAKKREVLYETPRDVELGFHASTEQRRLLLATQPNTNSTILSELDSKRLLQAYDIPTTPIELARDANEVESIGERLGYPLVMKIHSPDITHKTEVQGVVLNLKNGHETQVAYAKMMETVARLRPEARIEGVTLQPMVTTLHGVELILGAKRDPIFGTVMMTGLGGITAELFQDRALELPPINERLAMRMLKSLQCWPLLAGYRGKPGVDMERLIQILLRFSTMLVEQPRIMEVDINPLLVSSEEMRALDARFVVGPEPSVGTSPYAHLATRPYPQEFEKRIELQDGSKILLRPIRPEDEPQWHALLHRCSPETLWSRFQILFKEATHEMATRFCFLDYDREIAIVAEPDQVDSDPLPILGVGRMVADADHRSAEFALLIEDDWQNRGLGSALAEHCMEIAKPWGISELVAETTPQEPRMIAILRQMGFDVDLHADEKYVMARKRLEARG
ncbi:MAG: bifunctional acetate--CoA ligase family protein/GNAT family N-acetyltransferase [Pirellulales bacterium]